MRTLVTLALLLVALPAAADVANPPGTIDAGPCTPDIVGAEDECVECVNSYCAPQGYVRRCRDLTDAGVSETWCKLAAGGGGGCAVGQRGALAGIGGGLLLVGLGALILRRRGQ
jgi:MYXO-CTERM domain-containing protein